MDNLLAYYEQLRTMPLKEMSNLWEETDMHTWNDMLECVPPRVYKDGCFLVGEITTFHEEGPIYEAYVLFAGRFFHRPAVLKTFVPMTYYLEIKHKFGL